MHPAIQSAVSEAIRKITALSHPDSLILPLFSDLHTPAVNFESTRLLTEILDMLTQEIPCSAVIDLGDNADMLGRKQQIPNDVLAGFFTDLLSSISCASHCPLLCVPGNHDALGTEFFEADYWNAVVKKRFGHTDAVYDTEGAYYYRDFDHADTRLVVLSVPTSSDIHIEYPKPVWRFGERQLRWLKETALASDKHILLFMHAPFFSEYRGSMTTTLGVWTGERTAVSYIGELCGRIEQAAEAAEIINAFAEKNGRLTACFSGHTHTDSLRMGLEDLNGYKNPLVCPQCVTRSFWKSEFRGTAPTDNFGFGMDVLVWTPSVSSLHLLRIGDGKDRQIL